MSPTTHDVDPEGDLVIVLKKPNMTKVIPEVSLRRELKLGENDPTFFSDIADVKSPLMPSGLPGNAAIAGESDEIRFRVSSPHLKLASVVFNKMLNGLWMESQVVNDQSDLADADTEDLSPSSSPDQETDSTGSPVTSSADLSPSNPSASRISPEKEVTVTEWHAHALLTVLNIIHHKNSKVPQNVSVEFVAQVAVIAHFYDCAEALSATAGNWHHMIYKRPEKYGKEAIMWLFISWVFSWSDMFVGAARLIVQGGEGLNHVTTHDLPILDILEKLNRRRKEAIHELTNQLRIMDGQLRHGKKGCNATCRSVLIGSLVIEKQNNGDLLLWCGLLDDKAVSLSKVIDAINDFTPTQWHDSSGCAHPCSAKGLMVPYIRNANAEAKVKLADFKRKL